MLVDLEQEWHGLSSFARRPSLSCLLTIIIWLSLLLYDGEVLSCHDKASPRGKVSSAAVIHTYLGLAGCLKLWLVVATCVLHIFWVSQLLKIMALEGPTWFATWKVGITFVIRALKLLPFNRSLPANLVSEYEEVYQRDRDKNYTKQWVHGPIDVHGHDCRCMRGNVIFRFSTRGERCESILVLIFTQKRQCICRRWWRWFHEAIKCGCADSED